MKMILAVTALALTLGACSTLDNIRDKTKDNTNSTMTQDKVMKSACEARTITVFFDTGSADFDMAASAELDNIAAAYEGCNLYRIKVAGYADSVGDSDANFRLANKRAESVIGSLQVRGVSADRVSVMSMGDRTAIGTGADAYERRAVVTLIP